MDIKEISSNSLSFIGDAVYTLRVREHFISLKYQSSKGLQKLCNQYNSARGQTKAFNKLINRDFINNSYMEIYKRGRNHITHIPKNGDLLSYETASGLEALTGYLYLTDRNKLEEMFDIIFDGELDV